MKAKGHKPWIREHDFYSKIVGDSHDNDDGTSRQEFIRHCHVGEVLRLIPQQDNPVDPNAIAVFRANGQQLGYVSAEVAEELTAHLRVGMFYHAAISDLTGGTPDRPTRGVNLLISIDRLPQTPDPEPSTAAILGRGVGWIVLALAKVAAMLVMVVLAVLTSILGGVLKPARKK